MITNMNNEWEVMFYRLASNKGFMASLSPTKITLFFRVDGASPHTFEGDDRYNNVIKYLNEICV